MGSNGQASENYQLASLCVSETAPALLALIVNLDQAATRGSEYVKPTSTKTGFRLAVSPCCSNPILLNCLTQGQALNVAPSEPPAGPVTSVVAMDSMK